jgi:hypothetical protein
MMRKSYARLVCPSVALAALALACCASQWHPGIQNFKKIEIDPTTLKVTLEEPLPLNSPVGYDYYALFRGATTVTVDHGGPSGSKIAYNALDLDDDGNLMMRIKSRSSRKVHTERFTPSRVTTTAGSTPTSRRSSTWSRGRIWVRTSLRRKDSWTLSAS